MDYAYLRVKTGVSERPVDLSGVPLTIGRHENNRLVINDNMASRFHCVVERVGTDIKLRDLQSRNGTLLNGQRVMQASLKSGDVIAIGSVRLTLVVHNVQPGAGKPAADSIEKIDELEVLDDLEVIEDAPLGAPLVQGESVFTRLRTISDQMLNRTFDIDQIQVFNIRGKALRDTPAPGAVPGAVTSDTDMLLRLILLICFRSHATDIHLEPRSEDFLLRLRMDGNLLDMVPLDRDMGTRLTALVKVLCELDTTQRTIVQEGHFAARAPNAPASMGSTMAGMNQVEFRRVDYRVSFVPTLHGQKLVVRVFDTANAPLLLQDLHLPDSIAEHVGRELTRDTGLILVCGPTGSGKTTTLYSLLRSCGSTFRNIVTIEDPVEVQIEGTTQLPVDEENGKGFAALLRSVLRQDPDVIMVGEIRDPETARIALQASMTGHLVLSTIHTRDTIGTVYRLLDLGIEPYMVAQGLQLVLAQRLVRTLCKSCRRPVPLTPDDRRKLGPAGERVERIYAPAGCPKCLGTGFYSRRGFFEFLATSDKLREQIMTNPSLTEMQKMVGPEFVRLSDHGYQLVAEGATSIDEVERAIGR